MSYHQRLKSRSPSASEIEEQKRRMSQMPTIEELERRLGEAEQSFRDASEFLGVPPEEIPVDDGTPPVPPASVIVSPFYHQLDVTWTEPPAEDHVVRAFLRVRKKSNPAEQTTSEVSLWGGYAADLPVEAHLVDAFFEDRWGRRSDWSVAIEATPMLTAAESIDLTKAEIAGSLGWENLDALDANSGLTLAERQAKLGDDVITAQAMAAQDLAATRLWAQTGAFESAMIKELSVDKLTAGTFTAGQITLAGMGTLKAGGITLDSGGLTMPLASGFNSPASEREFKIAAINDSCAISFFSDSHTRAGNIRGVGLRADGVPGSSRRGAISMQATSAGNTGAGDTARLDIYSDPGGGTIATDASIYAYNTCYFGPGIWLIQNGSSSTGALLEFKADNHLYFGGVRLT